MIELLLLVVLGVTEIELPGAGPHQALVRVRYDHGHVAWDNVSPPRGWRYEIKIRAEGHPRDAALFVNGVEEWTWTRSIIFEDGFEDGNTEQWDESFQLSDTLSEPFPSSCRSSTWCLRRL
jgi:hypothetical protein